MAQVSQEYSHKTKNKLYLSCLPIILMRAILNTNSLFSPLSQLRSFCLDVLQRQLGKPLERDEFFTCCRAFSLTSEAGRGKFGLVVRKTPNIIVTPTSSWGNWFPFAQLNSIIHMYAWATCALHYTGTWRPSFSFALSPPVQANNITLAVRCVESRPNKKVRKWKNRRQARTLSAIRVDTCEKWWLFPSVFIRYLGKSRW